jgi:Rrf2 family protein
VLLPQTAEYALRAVIHIARHQDAGPVRVNTMAALLDVPQNYLSKTLHQLARAGVLRSTRGPSGGFRLAGPPEALTLERVIAPFADTGARRCLIADRPCGVDQACPVHERWRHVSGPLHAFFGGTTIGDLLADGARAPHH